MRMGVSWVEADRLSALWGHRCATTRLPNPRAMVEDILARVSLLDAELARHAARLAQQHAPAAETPAASTAGPSISAQPPAGPQQPAEQTQAPVPVPAAQQQQIAADSPRPQRPAQVCRPALLTLSR